MLTAACLKARHLYANLLSYLLFKLCSNRWRCVSLCSCEQDDPWSSWLAIFWPSTFLLVFFVSSHVGVSLLNSGVLEFSLLLIHHTHSFSLYPFPLPHLAWCNIVWAPYLQTSRNSRSSTTIVFSSKAGVM